MSHTKRGSLTPEGPRGKRLTAKCATLETCMSTLAEALQLLLPTGGTCCCQTLGRAGAPQATKAMSGRNRTADEMRTPLRLRNTSITCREARERNDIGMSQVMRMHGADACARRLDESLGVAGHSYETHHMMTSLCMAEAPPSLSALLSQDAEYARARRKPCSWLDGRAREACGPPPPKSRPPQPRAKMAFSEWRIEVSRTSQNFITIIPGRVDETWPPTVLHVVHVRFQAPSPHIPC